MPEESRESYINARCTEAKKEEYIELAENFGFDNFSEFIITLLDSLSQKYLEEGWECHLIHVNGETILAAEAQEVGGVPMATAAFKIIAPERFWAHVRSATVVKTTPGT